ncbi:MAG TPA: serine protease [Vicinamibacterales bacterium]
MLRALVLATLFIVIPRAGAGQPVSVLHIRVTLVDAERKATPVPNHALLISDNPATSTPRRVVTAIDGTVDVRLRPGNYTVESDEPMAFQGKAYQWTQMLDIVAGRDAVLELTVANAEVGTAASAVAATTEPIETSLSSLLMQWQDSVVALWTPTAHASGFVIDANGLIATSQRAIGTATSIEVQLTPAVKVAARLLVADRERDVAVLWIDPTPAASVRPVSLGCAQPAKPGGMITEGQQIITIGAPLRQQKGPAFGTVNRVEAHTIASDLILPVGSAGGPVFTTGGIVIGLTSVPTERDPESSARQRGNSRVVRIEDVCDVVASAEKKVKGAVAPNGTHLPVEPIRPFPEDALKDAARQRTGSLSPSQTSSSDFDIAFITPVQIFAAQGKTIANRLMDFSNWSEYVANTPPVLLVRVTPKLVESFWATVARGAAYTQGASIPPIRHVKSGFLRMRAFCGDAEVTPIHPFRLEQHVSESDTIHEGLYVFDPDALGPQCPGVKLVLYSEKDSKQGDTRMVDPKVLQQVWQDFASYRALQ